MDESKQVAHVLWRSHGGIRRHVRTLALRPPCGFETSGIWGPRELRGYFDGLPFHPVTRAQLLTSGHDADVIHAHGLTAGVAALARRRPPVVLSLHVVHAETGRTARSSLTSSVGRLIASRADGLVAVSQRAAAAFPAAQVIAPAFDPLPQPSRDRASYRAMLGIDPDDVVVVCVSRLERSKRLEVFIAAIEAAGCAGWIAGDGPEREHLEALATGSRVSMLGHRDDIAGLHAAADLFALPSSSESYGIAVAEAISSGLPVIATRTGAIAELVGSAGIVVEPGDEDAFVAAVCELVNDAGKRASFAAVAQSSVRPDVTALIAELGKVYDAAIEGKR